MGFSVHVCIFFFFIYAAGAWAWCAEERGFPQLTDFDKLDQPALTGFGWVLRALPCMHACTCVYVWVCMSALHVGGAGLIGGQKKVCYTMQETYWIYSARSRSQEPDLQHVLPSGVALCKRSNVQLFTLIRRSERLTRVYMLLCLFPAPIPFRRAEEATGRRHGPHHLTSKQLVSQDFRSPYLRHQPGSAFHYEKLSPPSTAKCHKKKPSPLHSNTHGGAHTGICADNLCGIIVHKLLGCSGVIGEVFHG